MKVQVLKSGQYLNEELKAIVAKKGQVISVPANYGKRMMTEGFFLEVKTPQVLEKKLDEKSPEKPPSASAKSKPVRTPVKKQRTKRQSAK